MWTISQLAIMVDKLCCISKCGKVTHIPLSAEAEAKYLTGFAIISFFVLKGLQGLGLHCRLPFSDLRALVGGKKSSKRAAVKTEELAGLGERRGGHGDQKQRAHFLGSMQLFSCLAPLHMCYQTSKCTCNLKNIVFI